MKSLVAQAEQLVQASHFDAATIGKKSREISRRYGNLISVLDLSDCSCTDGRGYVECRRSPTLVGTLLSLL